MLLRYAANYMRNNFCFPIVLFLLQKYTQTTSNLGLHF